MNNSFFDVSFSRLNSVDLQKYLNGIEMGRTRDYLLGLLRSGFDKAVQLEYIDKNPCLSIEIEDYEPVERRAFTEKEQRRFVSALVDSNDRVRFMLYLTTGIRRNEILRISPDFKKKMLYVDGTKTTKSKRYVPLTDIMAQDLSDFYALGRDFKINFCNSNRNFRFICYKLKIKDVCLHSLRHTFATRCYESGIPVRIIGEWLGHNDEQVTRIYIHKLLEYQMKNKGLINKVF